MKKLGDVPVSPGCLIRDPGKGSSPVGIVTKIIYKFLGGRYGGLEFSEEEVEPWRRYRTNYARQPIYENHLIVVEVQFGSEPQDICRYIGDDVFSLGERIVDTRKALEEFWKITETLGKSKKLFSQL